MDTSIDTFSVTELRHKTNQVLKEVDIKGVVYLVKRSKPTAAMVDIAYLRVLQDTYEDYLDTLEFDKTVTLKRVPLEKHKR